jgi:predicted 3-demethylubiquinone-9 3-methyltransferase (glyoxalase superfamily)
MPAASPSGPPDSVSLVDFTLMGMKFFAMAAGPLDPFNHAISFTVKCEDQAEVDKYYAALLAGGEEENCGWVKDKFGVRWQIVPKQLADWVSDPDRAKARRVAEVMMKMKKLDLAALQAAADGK